MMDRRGFTLIELMTVSMLAGILLVIALPLLILGQNAGERVRKTAELSAVGDGIFEYISEELKAAERLCIGDGKENRPAGGEWKALYVDTGRENVSDILMRWSGEVSSFDRLGEPFYEEVSYLHTDLALDLRIVEENGVFLSVKLLDGGTVVYEREEVLWLLNLSSETDECVKGYEEGDEYGEQEMILWYQK